MEKAWFEPPSATFIHCPASDVDELQVWINHVCQERQWATFKVELFPYLNDLAFLSVRGPHLDIQPADPWVIVDGLCGNAVLRGADIFIPGLLAMCPSVKSGCLVSVYVDMDGHCLRGATVYHGTKRFLGNGIAKVSRDEVYKQNTLKGLGIQMTQPIYTSPPLNGHPKFRLQNLPSILAGYAVNPQKDDLILDMCAAPGGKTLHLDFLSQQKCTIVALDRSASRLETLLNATKDSASIFPFVCDSSSSVMAKSIDIPSPKEWVLESLKTMARGSKVKKWPRNGFDRILLDAPCSALGQRPNVYLEPCKSELKALKAHAQKQQCLLQAALKLLKPGGRLVYSTCTFSPFENEDNVAFVLKKFPEMSLVSFGSEWHERGVSKGWNREGLADPFLGPEDREKVLRFDLDTQIQLPDGQHVDTIGFFIAVFEKQIN